MADKSTGHMTDRADKFAGKLMERHRKAVPKPEPAPTAWTGDAAMADTLRQISDARKKLRASRS